LHAVSYDATFNGLAHGAEEGERIASQIKGSDDRVLFMANHGILAVRESSLEVEHSGRLWSRDRGVDRGASCCRVMY
jgi:hypothetical protein